MKQLPVYKSYIERSLMESEMLTDCLGGNRDVDGRVASAWASINRADVLSRIVWRRLKNTQLRSDNLRRRTQSCSVLKGINLNQKSDISDLNKPGGSRRGLNHWLCSI